MMRSWKKQWQSVSVWSDHSGSMRSIFYRRPMKPCVEAIRNLGVAPDILLNDAVTIPEVSIPQVPIIKGDAKSISIGAASIIAKVTRDRLMAEYDELMPEYGFASNKGYGSAEHIAGN